MKVKHLRIVSVAAAIFAWLGLQSQANTFFNGGTADWNTPASWDNGVPGSTDNRGWIRTSGTLNVSSTPANSGSVPRIKSFDGNNYNAGDVTINWNPGAASTYLFDQIVLGDNHNGSSATIFNHASGTIRADSGWYHIARRGTATYTMTGTSVLQPDDRLSIAEGANGGPSHGVLEMRNSSKVDGQYAGASNNDYYLAHNSNANGWLTMFDNSVFDVPRLEVARQNSAQGTITQNGNSRIAIEHDFDAFALQNDTKAWWTMNDNSVATVGSNFRPGRYDNSQATVVLNSNASFTSGQFGAAIEKDRNSSSTIVMNGSSRMTVNGWMELGGGQATMTMNDLSVLDANGRLAVGMRSSAGSPGDGISRLIINGQASVEAGGDIFHVGHQVGSKGLVEMNSTGHINSDNVAIGRQGSGQVVWNSGIWKNKNWMVMGQESGGVTGDGTLTINGGAIIVNSDGGGGNLQVGERTAGHLIMNGGVLEVNNQMDIARDHRNINDATNDSSVNHNGGDIFVKSQLHMGGKSTVTHGNHHYNLDGGTLHVNNIHMGNAANIAGSTTFNWGAGTLTTRAVNENASGNGSVITITGDLTTGYAGNVNAASTLDLGDLYKDGGTKYDTVVISGALNLSSNADVLDFWNDMQHLRANGATITTGEIKLIGAASVAGSFDNVIAPVADSTFFRTWTAAEATALSITGANDLTRNRGAVIYRADGVYFAYNVSGQIPEPATGMFLLFGTLTLRGISVFRRNQRARKMLSEIG
jgi:hypothetical protein